MEFKTANHRIDYDLQGPEDGPVIVFLHDGLGSKWAWREQIPAFTGAGYRVIAYDRWGYGRSDPRPGIDIPFFEDDLVDLENLLDSLCPAPANLVGHSDGGNIALAFAVRNPEKVRSLVCVAAHVYVQPKMRDGILKARQDFEMSERLRAGLARQHGDKTRQVFYHWFDGWYNERNLAWDMRPDLAHIRCPALIVQGMDDEYATPQHAADIAAAVPNAGLFLAPQGAHRLPQQMPELFNCRILEFVKSLHTTDL
ncbi:MAG: alpha/beta fold hydrolase [Omnitrophica WOR_2 bacterium]